MNDDLIFDVSSARAARQYAEGDPVIDALFLFRGGTQFAQVIGLLVNSFEDPHRTGIADWGHLNDALATNAGFAFEVLLKSYLVTRGAEFSALSNAYGHNLGKLLASAQATGLQLDAFTAKTVQTIGSDVHIAGSTTPAKWHIGHRYKRPGGHLLSTPAAIEAAVKEIHTAAGEAVLAKLMTVDGDQVCISPTSPSA